MSEFPKFQTCFLEVLDRTLILGSMPSFTVPTTNFVLVSKVCTFFWKF